MVIRAALSGRTGHWLPNGQRVPNGALVSLDPAELERDPDLGGGEVTQAS